MNKLLIAAIAAFSPVVLAATAQRAEAQTTALGVGQSASQSSAGALAGANSSNALIFNSPSHVTTNTRGRIVQTVPGIGPALAASAVNTCLGSVSAGVGVTGLGLSFGSTYLEKHCEARMTGTLLNQMGAKQAGLLALCHNPMAYDAMAASGIRCPFGSGSGGYQPQPVAAPAVVAAPAGRQQVYAAAPVQRVAHSNAQAERELQAAQAARASLYNQCVAQNGSNCSSFR